MASSGNNNASLAAPMSLSMRHLFGVNTNVVDNISFTDDENVVYFAGHTLVIYNITEQRQRFLQSSEITESVTALASGPGRR